MPKQDPAEHLLPSSDAPATEQGIDLVSVFIAVVSEWRIAIITFVIFSILGLLYIFSLKPQYVATASFLPQEGRVEATNFAAIFSNRGPGALYIGLLQSQTVENNVIALDNLTELFHTSSMEVTRDRLAGISTFAEGADGIVTVSVRDGNAQDAARIANSYLTALNQLNLSMGKQQSKQTIGFFNEALNAEREELSKAEDVLSRTQKQTGVISESQTGNTLAAIQSTRDQITALESQRAVLLLSETEQNPQVERLTENIAVLRSKEAQLEGGGSTPVGAATPAGQAPEANLEVIRAQREVKYHEVLVNSLANQSETAQLNDAFARSAFQKVDDAVAPERKAWPPRRPYLIFALMFAAFMGLIAVTIKLMIGRLLRDPEHRDRLRQLRQAVISR